MPAFHELAREALPGLTPSNYRMTSPATWNYNCIAWAAGVTDAWWWPSPQAVHYWPEGVPREETLEAFVQAFVTCGFVPAEDGLLEHRGDLTRLLDADA